MSENLWGNNKYHVNLVLVVFILLQFVVSSFLSSTARADSVCKSWVLLESVCSPGSCSQHSQWWCDVDGPLCIGPKYYTSSTTRESVYYGMMNSCADLCSKVPEEYKCDPCVGPNKITSFSADKTVITAGEAVTFSWDYTKCVDNAKLTVGNQTFSGGKSATWTGTDADLSIKEPKTYSATLTVSDDCCGSDTSKPIKITVNPPPKCKTCPCPEDSPFSSSVSLLTGALKQSESLFAAKGGGLVPAIALSYNSLIPRIGAMGAKWSHNYEIALTVDNDYSVTIQEANTYSRFLLINGVYVSSTADTATLVKTADNTYSLTRNDGSYYKFNTDGQLLSTADLNDNRLSFAYDTAGNLVTVIDAAGRTTAFVYDGNKRLTTITDPAGKNYTFIYSGNLLSTITWPDNSTWHYTYDANGLMLSKTDPLGKVTTYTYDDNLRVVQGTPPNGITKVVAHPTATSTVRSSTITDNNGGVWTYTYDSHYGYMTQKTDPLGKITTYAYDANQNRIKETAPDGSITSFTYDGAGNRLSMTDALGNTTTYTYNSLGQVTSSTDPLGRTTTNTYNSTGQLLQTIDPLGAKTTNSYDTKGNLTSVTNALNQTSTFAYDSAGNQTSSTDPSGATSSFTYDAMGNMLTQTDPQGKVTTFEYDGCYRLAKVTDPLGNVTTYAYDAKGNKTSQTDANGNVTRYEYDDQGHLVKTIDALGFTTSYTYGSTGCTSCGSGTDKLMSLTDAKGQTTSYQYDLLGRLTQETDPLGKVTTYAYDVVGSLITKTDANNAAITYTYDALKRLTKKSYPDSTSVNYTYDAVGRVLTSGNASVAYTYAYDAAGRVTSVTDSRGYTIANAYGSLGNRTRMTVQPGTADERVTTYYYDTDNRLTGITSNAGTFTYGYDSLGRRRSLAYPNGITTGYNYDDGGRLTALNHGTVASFTYTLDKVGNRTGKTTTEAEQYLYDSIYRLLTVTSTKPEAFSFDQIGNRLTGPGAKDTAYLYNAGNQMLQGRKLQYGYDNAGNQTTKTVPNATDKSWTHTWDFESRLIKMEKIKGAEKKTVIFTYDPQGRRIGKQVTSVIEGLQSYVYVYDNDNIVLEVLTDGSGTNTTYFTHGVGVDEHLALERNGSFYYHADALGNVTTVTDHDGSVVQSYEYDSFGMVKASTGFRNSYTYTGREWDKEAGLYYYRARYYDPMEGRFIQKDPIGFRGGDVNLYGYVQNRPIILTDPTGLAYFAKRHLSFLPLALTNPNDEKYSCELVHEQLFFEDEKLPTNIGYFSDSSVPRPDSAKELSTYTIISSQHFNDCVMREAVNKVKTKPYLLLGYNCQNWAKEVRNEYSKLIKNPEIKKRCCIQ